ncbi:MAG TPA: hypothetical protein VK814_17515 [Acidobacteriaceae bacterium]|jgi:hypothetical protein|nr:hypothetical protein [Acidobacteriaceae bacterium]
MTSFPRNSLHEGKTNSSDTTKLSRLEEKIGAVGTDRTPAGLTRIHTAATITPERRPPSLP